MGVRSAEHPDFKTYSIEDLLAGKLPVLPSRGVNIRSIAESTGLPKESTRRKVTELAAAGWIERRRNALFLTAEGYRQLQPTRENLWAFAARGHEIVEALMAGRTDGTDRGRDDRPLSDQRE